jgi:Ca2+:H+ antiporter
LRSETVPSLGALHEKFTRARLQEDVLKISQATSVVLMVAFFLYIWFCASSQHSIFDEVIEQDEHNDADRQIDMEKPKFTMTETVIALLLSLVCVTMLLVFLVEKIEYVVESGEHLVLTPSCQRRRVLFIDACE